MEEPELPETLDGFEWDQAKSDTTLAERGFGFDAAAQLFEGIYLESEDTRHDYGERRFKVIGDLRGVVTTLIWTPRGTRRRTISAWPSSNQERREYCAYREALQRGDPQHQAPN